jgi:hypothetical protein
MEQGILNRELRMKQMKLFTNKSGQLEVRPDPTMMVDEDYYRWMSSQNFSDEEIGYDGEDEQSASVSLDLGFSIAEVLPPLLVENQHIIKRCHEH